MLNKIIVISNLSTCLDQWFFQLFPDCAPHSVSYILELLQLRHCVGCQFYRAESRGNFWDSEGNHLENVRYLCLIYQLYQIAKLTALGCLPTNYHSQTFVSLLPLYMFYHKDEINLEQECLESQLSRLFGIFNGEKTTYVVYFVTHTHTLPSPTNPSKHTQTQHKCLCYLLFIYQCRI